MQGGNDSVDKPAFCYYWSVFITVGGHSDRWVDTNVLGCRYAIKMRASYSNFEFNLRLSFREQTDAEGTFEKKDDNEVKYGIIKDDLVNMSRPSERNP